MATAKSGWQPLHLTVAKEVCVFELDYGEREACICVYMYVQYIYPGCALILTLVNE